MSYQALARKWRPRRFSELVGQEHVVRALTHALDSGRLHHALLFTGTRGVGKTTIARIFAKSLNCDRGPTSEPCGECSACTEIDAGRFVDLLEIDAASNTGIDNVRELIDNAQYAPTRGRHKVYLIDEVHMLSRSAFNALLKTLEEPPPHVKFLLATTDPQKLPITVLSRCIKFNLKRLSPEQIGGQLRHILGAEQVAFDEEAVATLSLAADGSLRDGLSLLDQAIAHGGGVLKASEVHAMLGTVERAKVQQLLAALAAGDATALLAEVEHIASFAPDFGQVLDELAGLLHRVQLAQLVATAGDPAASALATTLSAQDVQLWYQIAVTGRRDLPLAPTPRTGFEMSLLRMLAFAPGGVDTPAATGGERAPAAGTVRASAAPAPAAKPAAKPTSAAAAPRAADLPTASADPVATDDWAGLIERAGLRGPAGQLAQHASLLRMDGNTLHLALDARHEHLLSKPLVAQLEGSLGAALGREIRLRFDLVAAGTQAATPAQQRVQAANARQSAAQSAVADDPVVRTLIDTFGARVIADSVRPLDH